MWYQSGSIVFLSMAIPQAEKEAVTAFGRRNGIAAIDIGKKSVYNLGRKGE